MTTPSDEKMKIPEDLTVWYSVACDGIHFQTDHAAIKTLIERIARAEAQLSAPQEQVRQLEQQLEKAAERPDFSLDAREWKERARQAEEQVRRLESGLKDVRFNVAYAYQPDNCGDHCRNSCRDCVLKNTLDDIDEILAARAALSQKEPTGSK